MQSKCFIRWCNYWSRPLTLHIETFSILIMIILQMILFCDFLYLQINTPIDSFNLLLKLSESCLTYLPTLNFWLYCHNVLKWVLRKRFCLFQYSSSIPLCCVKYYFKPLLKILCIMTLEEMVITFCKRLFRSTQNCQKSQRENWETYSNSK